MSTSEGKRRNVVVDKEDEDEAPVPLNVRISPIKKKENF
jgi:hypothetical protein